MVIKVDGQDLGKAFLPKDDKSMKPSMKMTMEEMSSFKEIISEAGFMLPQQAILDNFVHHNPWENLQPTMEFWEAHVFMDAVMKHKSPGKRMYNKSNVDPRLRAHAATVELCSLFLDRGSAKWTVSSRTKGFLQFFADLEELGSAAWREHAREMAQEILNKPGEYADSSSGPPTDQEERNAIQAGAIVMQNMDFFGVAPTQVMATQRSMFMELAGWAGMFRRMEMYPVEAAKITNEQGEEEMLKVRLVEFAAVQSILMRSSIAAMARECGWNELNTPMGEYLGFMKNVEEGAHESESESEEENLQNPSALAWVNQNQKMVMNLEKEYEEALLGAVQNGPGKTMMTATKSRPSVQVYTCIDEREESIRRLLEKQSSEIETFGVPGFFGVQIKYQGPHGVTLETLAPEGAKPPFTVIEKAVGPKAEAYESRRGVLAQMAIAYEKASFSPIYCLLLAMIFPLPLVFLVYAAFFPTAKRRFIAWFEANVAPEPERDFDLPFTLKDGANQLAMIFKNIGMKEKDQFAPVVFLFGHGARTVNNPYYAAYCCGACGGREGGPNARLFAKCGNNPAIRSLLKELHDIEIPDDTFFVGAFHDTCSDMIQFFDTDLIPAAKTNQFKAAFQKVEKARKENALERCAKFATADHIKTEEEASEHVYTRSTDLAEPRPELGHSTNAAVIIGPRDCSYGLDMQRRVFAVSYDPFADDDRGSALERLITPSIIVCSGISLEYLFSCVEGGAGTKVATNVVGYLGVQQGTNGDLLHGLPTQMGEAHSPLRALYLVNTPVDRMKTVFARRRDLGVIAENEWFRLFIRDPYTNKIYKQVRGEYVEVSYAHKCAPPPVTTMPPFNSQIHEYAAVPFDDHLKHIKGVRAYENFLFYTVTCGMMGVIAMLNAFAARVDLTYPDRVDEFFTYVEDSIGMEHGKRPLNDWYAPTGIGAYIIMACVLAYARRYHHGDVVFDRFTMCTAMMCFGFALLAAATTLKGCLLAWTCLTFGSGLLIGMYNDRPTARENATYVFTVYQMSETALLLAITTETYDPAICGFLICLAAMLKTSQFPVNDLFPRSMEGSTVSSAIGYAALSAHCGIVLLAGTKMYWYDNFMFTRIFVATIGACTAVTAGMVAKVRPDRKGAVGNAIAATVGVIYIIMALGFFKEALILAFGHACVRTAQVLRAPNCILDNHQLTACMKAAGAKDSSATMSNNVSDVFFRMAWKFHRMSQDRKLPYFMHKLPLNAMFPKMMKAYRGRHLFGKWTQYTMAAVLLLAIGFPGPYALYEERFLVNDLRAANGDLMKTVQALAITALYFVVLPVTTMWVVFAKVLDTNRFYPHDVSGVKPGYHARFAQDAAPK